MTIASDSAPEGAHLLYVADPMCSWCYGFSPVIGAIATHFGDRLPVRLMMGGLRAGNTKAMRPADKDYIRDAWTRVNAATGQPFDHAFFEREGFVYDTEPACRAVVTGRRLDASHALALMGRISAAFYAENKDVTQGETLADLAEQVSYDRDAFAAALLSPDVRNETFRDFLTAQEIGIRGFPTLLASKGGGNYALVTNGYHPLEGLCEALEGWLGAPARA
jgi:putative protein-disulfide isomerase